MKYSDFDDSLQAFVFELDNVLLPVKDYDLQVYYLFANFLEYLEPQFIASNLVDFIKHRYDEKGNLQMFEELQATFNINPKYKENLELLFTNAKLPLKLLLYREILELLQEIIVNRKQVFVLTAGLPQVQLNKIQQTEWHGLDKFLKVYFVDEFMPKPNASSLSYILSDNHLNKKETVFIGLSNEDRSMATNAGVRYVNRNV